ncbi:Hsp33 family molecular chaperone HslO [Alkaliphilus oremlandii]|uniref:33 kDa chaperonin n=1 Tax=Alkaliphilus oremlandii (strain OhILAs) TaxID=350688 RepID=HSLO_ALKOO|nr:Hsp33 family molecular chaperone HslO [Alkaliphilus oremlandii]A8MIA8.1 RecName: Full=33 kDa chaperonin; AltName: Full=Heat shock protein 33 homolog; Short=HSP33 [Alkaliphilus oremlandii OhILAs]ABW19540.1 Hsp33 protein [Alkaliphilus oremlandii OhILAs]
MKNTVIRGTAASNQIRVFVANTTEMVAKAQELQMATPVAIAALGRTLTATSMMGLMSKSEKEKITVNINGGGPLGPIVVVGNSKGIVKGYVSHPHVEGSNLYPGKLDVGSAVGTDGTITVVKDLGLKEPYIGTYPLSTGEIAEDFAAYFAFSEQQPSGIALGVLVDVDYTIKAAGGYIIQVLPNIEEETLTKLESKLSTLEPITSIIDRIQDPEEILNHILGEFEPVILETYDVDFVCDCSEERLEQVLISIGEKELTEIIEEDKQAELVCHFCNKKYHFDEEHLNKLRSEILNKNNNI